MSQEILLLQITRENHNCCKWEGGLSMQKFFLIKVFWKDLEISLSWTRRKKIKEWGKDQQGYHHTSLAESMCLHSTAESRQKLFSTRGRCQVLRKLAIQGFGQPASSRLRTACVGGPETAVEKFCRMSHMELGDLLLYKWALEFLAALHSKPAKGLSFKFGD